MKLKGEIDPELAIDLSNKATLAFLQRHLGKSRDTAAGPAGRFFKLCWAANFDEAKNLLFQG